MQPAILTYMTLRVLLGWLGLALPLSLLTAAWPTDSDFQPSISEYFYTPARDILEGTLVSMAAFLFSYRGYPKSASDPSWLTDRIVALAAASGAFGVAAIPISASGASACSFLGCLMAQYHWPTTLTDGLHLSSAILFFGATAVFALVNFQRGDRSDPETAGKYLILTVCGWVIIGCLGLLIARKLGAIWVPQLGGSLGWPDMTFCLESLAVWAFALAWLVKGEAAGEVGARALRRIGAHLTER